MKKTKIMTTAAVLGLGAVGLWQYKRAEGSEAPPYRLATVERGSLESAVSATGTLGAVTTVQVGTQVSGQISAIYADFNDRVKKGQLIARIDPTLQQQAVQDAQAGLDRARAQLEQARQEYDRNKQLFEAKIVTASEFGSVKSNYQVAQANVKSAHVTLDRARQNAEIRMSGDSALGLFCCHPERSEGSRQRDLWRSLAPLGMTAGGCRGPGRGPEARL